MIGFDPDLSLNEISNLYLLLETLLLINFINKLGKSFPFIDIIPILAVALWGIVPASSYLAENDLIASFTWMHMPIAYQSYFSITTPAIYLLIIGIYFPMNTESFNMNDWQRKVSNVKANRIIGIYLIIFGIASSFLASIGPQSLAFILFLFSTSLFTGTYFLFFSNSTLKYLAIVLYFIFPVQNTIQQGMFGDLIYWSAFIFIIVATKYSFKFLSKSIIVAVGFSALLFIQALKIEYREAIWFGTGELAGLSAETVMSKVVQRYMDDPGAAFSEEKVIGVLERFNQGKHIAYCYENVPDYLPFENGRGIFIAGMASIIPRFFWPDKPTSGGKESYEKFTGRPLVGNTSMNISPLGDGYVNFGKTGASIFMLFYGLFFNFINFRLHKFAIRFPTIVFWFPLLWLYLVQVETDFVSVLNHLIKSGIFILFIHYLVMKITKTDASGLIKR